MPNDENAESIDTSDLWNACLADAKHIVEAGWEDDAGTLYSAALARRVLIVDERMRAGGMVPREWTDAYLARLREQVPEFVPQVEATLSRLVAEAADTVDMDAVKYRQTLRGIRRTCLGAMARLLMSNDESPLALQMLAEWRQIQRTITTVLGDGVAELAENADSVPVKSD